MLNPPCTITPCHRGRGKTARIEGYYIHDATGVLPVAHVYNKADSNRDLKEMAVAFAAAPELLEALEAAVKDCLPLDESAWDDIQRGDDYPDWFFAAREAIAKAKGVEI